MNKEENALALQSHSAEMFSKAVMENASTSAKKMELKRRANSALTVALDSLIGQITGNDAPEPGSEEYTKKTNEANLLAMLAIAKHLDYLSDCLSFRYSRKTKKGETGYARIAAADSLKDIATVLAGRDGVSDHLVDVHSMLNDIGNHFQCFKSGKHGIHDPKKYIVDDDAGDASPEAEDNEVATDAEGGEDPIEEIKKKGAK